jgi:hypothetical protein
MSDDVWLGGNGSYQTAADWSLGHVPGTGDIADIGAAGTYTVTASTSVSVGTVQVAATATLSITAGTFQTVSTGGGSNINQGTIAIGGNATFDVSQPLDNTGTISLNSGGIMYAGASVTLTGHGTILLGGTIYAYRLYNFDNTIVGAGQILGPRYGSLTNGGTIDASQGSLTVANEGAGSLAIYNIATGVMEATGSATLYIGSDTYSLNNSLGDFGLGVKVGRTRA